MIISVEGNIGTGKSSLIKYLKHHYGTNKNIVFISEPVDEWLKLKDSDGSNILGKFYNDQERWSYTFQMNAFITRCKQILNHDKSGTLIILERSIITDRKVFAQLLYENKKISKLEWELYNNWFNWLSEAFNVKPDKYIYLYADPETSYSRIEKRQRAEEKDLVSYEYIKQVHDKHEEWLKGHSYSTTVNVNSDFVDDIKNRANIIQQITTIISQNFNVMNVVKNISLQEQYELLYC